MGLGTPALVGGVKAFSGATHPYRGNKEEIWQN